MLDLAFFIILAAIQPCQPKPNLLYISKEISEGDKRMNTQLYLIIIQTKTLLRNYLPIMVFFGEETSDLTLEKANYPENLLVYIYQASISPLKNNEEVIYVVDVSLAQLLPLVNSPPDIENYVCQKNEVKLLCSMYDTETRVLLN